MRTSRPISWIPLGVLAALVLSLAVAWSFRDRLSRTVECESLYAQATSTRDTAAVDAVVVVAAGARPAVTCGEVRVQDRGGDR